jgi:hypothetical protein
MKEFTLTVTEQELQVVSAGLAELPFKHVGTLIQKLQQQIIQLSQGQKLHLFPQQACRSLVGYLLPVRFHVQTQ